MRESERVRERVRDRQTDRERDKDHTLIHGCSRAWSAVRRLCGFKSMSEIERQTDRQRETERQRKDRQTKRQRPYLDPRVLESLIDSQECLWVQVHE